MAAKSKVFPFIGVVGSMVANSLGGWDTALQTLMIFMAIDYLSGIIVAGVF
ncbi:MAG: phage holin family protein, partial [Youngiibacter sp.]|nr:phage holin family protein [Youngiibacter sp.]